MKYDDASWHYGGNFPSELPDEAAATHIAMFVAWALHAGLAGELHTTDSPEDLAMLLNREVSPVTWFLAACDEKFTNEDLNDEGNRFAKAYYMSDEKLPNSAKTYLMDYEATFPEQADIYMVEDSWTSFDQLKPVLDQRLADWQRT